MDNLKQKIRQYLTDGKNLFSYTEKIVVALCHADLYQDLMPERYKNDPMGAYCHVLDGVQRAYVVSHHLGYRP